MNGLEVLCVFLITLVFYTHVKSNFITGSKFEVQTYDGGAPQRLKSIIRERAPVLFSKSESVIPSLKPLLSLKPYRRSIQQKDGIFTNHATLYLLYSDETPLTIRLFPPCALTDLSSAKDQHVEVKKDKILCVPQSWSFEIIGPGKAEVESYSNAFTVIANFIRPRLSFFLERIV